MPVTIDFTGKIEHVDRKLLVTESSRTYWSKRLLHVEMSHIASHRIRI